MLNQFAPEEIKKIHDSSDELKRKSLGKFADNLFAIERRNSQQSRLFMIDIIPHIHRLYFEWPRDKIMRVLDVGIESGAGTSLLAELHNPRSYNHLKMNVMGLDITDRYEDYIRLCHPFVKFIKQDIFDISEDQKWDLVICSHVIEHLKEPFLFVEKLRKLTSNYAIVACPYNEVDLRQGHLQTINDALISKFSPAEYYVYTNFCWRIKGQCLIMIFKSLF